MIVKKRGKTLEMMRLDALLRRLPESHYKKGTVQNDYKKKISELRGEREVDYPLGFLDDKDYLILHNVRLADVNGYFQIDTLILTEKYILILEVKNWYGTILFGENGQVTRVGDDQKEEGFANPIPQVKTQLHRLQKWIRSRGLPAIPIKFFVVISYPSTIIKSTSPNNIIPNEVIHNSQLFFQIEELSSKLPPSRLRMNQLINLSEQITRCHVPPTENILGKYNLSMDDLIKGVVCPSCMGIPMIRAKRKWFCNKCNHSSVNAHLIALNDYKLLIGDIITNRDSRSFLLIESSHVAKRLLKGANFKAIGSTSKRRYELTLNLNNQSTSL